MLDRSTYPEPTSDAIAGQATDFEVCVYRGAQDVQRAWVSLTADVRPLTPFQASDWLEATYQHLAPIYDGEPILIVARCANTDAFMCVLPLVVVHDSGLQVAGFPDFGLSDYGAPLVASMGDKGLTAQQAKILWESICRVLPEIDRISLTNMPLADAEHPNPLARLASARSSAHTRYVMELDDTVEAFLVSRGKKYRKEVERCFRLLADRGVWCFKRAQTPTEIAAAFEALERLQSNRWLGPDEKDYRLKNKVVSKFYSEALTKGDEAQGAQIFTLRCGEETIAVLYGLAFANTFTLLRIASASESWRRLSPGRLIVIEALRHFVARDVRCFDLGIGDYAFKRGLGAKALPLVDIEHALTWKAKPHIMLMQAKGWLRQHPQLLKAAKAARQKMSR